MKQNCQIKFDDRKRQLTIKFKTNSIEQNLTLSFDDIKKGLVKPLAHSSVQKLSYSEFKSLASEIAKRFHLDPSSALSWSEQFCKHMVGATAILHPADPQKAITPEQINLLKLDIKHIQEKFCKELGITPKDLSGAITAGYCSGADTMFCTDDYMTIRQGNTIVARIALPGNDYNELLKYFNLYKDAMLNPDNIESMWENIRKMKMDEALELAHRNDGQGYQTTFKLIID